MEKAEQKYFDLQFKTLNKGFENQAIINEQHRETQKILFTKIDEQQKVGADNSKVALRAEGVADEARKDAAEAKGGLDTHLIDHKKRFWLAVKWILGIAGPVIVAVLLLVLGLT